MTTESRDISSSSPLAHHEQQDFHIQQLERWHGRAIRKATRKGIVDSKKLLEHVRKDTPNESAERKKTRHIGIRQTITEFFSRPTKTNRRQQQSEESIQALGAFILRAHKEAGASTDKKILHEAMQTYHTLVKTHEQVYGKKIKQPESSTGILDAEREIETISRGDNTEISYFAQQIHAAIQRGKQTIQGLEGQARTQAEATLHHNILLLHKELLDFQSYKNEERESRFRLYTNKFSNLFEYINTYQISEDLTKEGASSSFTTRFCSLLEEATTKQNLSDRLNLLQRDEHLTEAQRQLAFYFIRHRNAYNIDNPIFLQKAIDTVQAYTGDRESLENASEKAQTEKVRTCKTALYEQQEEPKCTTEQEWGQYIDRLASTLTAKRADLKDAIAHTEQDREREAQLKALDAESKKTEAKGQLTNWLSLGMDRTSTESVKKATELVTQCADSESLQEGLEQIRKHLPKDHPTIQRADALLQTLSSPNDLQGTPEEIAAQFVQTREALRRAIVEVNVAIDNAAVPMAKAREHHSRLETLIQAFKNVGASPPPEMESLYETLTQITHNKWTDGLLHTTLTAAEEKIPQFQALFQQQLVKAYTSIGDDLRHAGDAILGKVQQEKHGGLNEAAGSLAQSMTEYTSSQPTDDLQANVNLALQISRWRQAIEKSKKALPASYYPFSPQREGLIPSSESPGIVALQEIYRKRHSVEGEEAKGVSDGKTAISQPIDTQAHEKLIPEINQLAQSIDEFEPFPDPALQARHLQLQRRVFDLQQKAKEISPETRSQALTSLQQEYKTFCNDVKKFWEGQFHTWENEYRSMGTQDRSFANVAEELATRATGLFGLSPPSELRFRSADTLVSQTLDQSLETLGQLFSNPSTKISVLHSAFLHAQQEFFSKSKPKEDLSQRIHDMAERGIRAGRQKFEKALQSTQELPQMSDLHQATENLSQAAREATTALRRIFGPTKKDRQ